MPCKQATYSGATTIGRRRTWRSRAALEIWSNWCSQNSIMQMSVEIATGMSILITRVCQRILTTTKCVLNPSAVSTKPSPPRRYYHRLSSLTNLQNSRQSALPRTLQRTGVAFSFKLSQSQVCWAHRTSLWSLKQVQSSSRAPALSTRRSFSQISKKRTEIWKNSSRSWLTTRWTSDNLIKDGAKTRRSLEPASTGKPSRGNTRKSKEPCNINWRKRRGPNKSWRSDPK